MGKNKSSFSLRLELALRKSIQVCRSAPFESQKWRDPIDGVAELCNTIAQRLEMN